MTEGELAVKMWEYVYQTIKEYAPNPFDNSKAKSVHEIKSDFLRYEGYGEYYWYNSCLLCNRYINEKGKCPCPLSEDGLDCGIGSSWLDVTRYYIDNTCKRKALRACKKILGIMRKEAKKDEMENSKEGE